MRQGNVWAAGLALGLGIGAAGVALGQEPASDAGWLSRLFGHGTPPATHKDEPREEKMIAPPSPAAQRAKAEADFLRRLEVCQKLQEIAFDTGDEQLKHRAEQLEQRAKDAYERRTNRGHAVVADEAPVKSRPAPRDIDTAPAAARRLFGGSTPTEGLR